MNNTIDRLWIAHRPYKQDEKVSVEYDPFSELWRVSQGKIEVILCSHLCLRNVEYHDKGIVSGYIATFQETRVLHWDMGHADDDIFDYECLSFDGKRWVIEEGKSQIEKSDYADMSAVEENQILAINI